MWRVPADSLSARIHLGGSLSFFGAVSLLPLPAASVGLTFSFNVKMGIPIYIGVTKFVLASLPLEPEPRVASVANGGRSSGPGP